MKINSLSDYNGKGVESAIVFPRGVEIYRKERVDIVTLTHGDINEKLTQELKSARLSMAEKIVGLDIRKQMAEAAFEIVDLNVKKEREFSDCDIIFDKEERRIIGYVLVRRGREHKRARRFCAGNSETIDSYLTELPEILKYPSQIPLVLRACDYTEEKLNALYHGSYVVDPESARIFMRAMLTKELFNVAPVPSHPALFYARRIYAKAQEVDETYKAQLKKWYQENTGNDTSYKSRSLDTGLYWEWFLRGPQRIRVACAGFTAIDRTGTIPLALSGDWVVAREYRRMSLGYPSRWLPYFNLFNQPALSNAVVALDFDMQNIPARRVFMENLKCEPISTQLYVTMRRQQ